MNRILIIPCLALCATISSCDRKNEEPVVKRDTYVEFKSHLGNTFVAPSQWTMFDKGDTFALNSPDGQATIMSIMYTAEGSGSLQEFGETMTRGLLPEGATDWQESDWTTIDIDGQKVPKRELVPVPESGERSWLYLVGGGKYYYAIVLTASDLAMELNGGFYEKLVQTFKGVRK